MNYEKQAKDFLEKTNTKIDIQFIDYDYYFEDDKEKRDVYLVTLKKPDKKIQYRFGNSIHNTLKNKTPTAYDVLAVVEKYHPDTFEEFCLNFGYVPDSVKARKIYRAALKQYLKFSNFYTEEEMEMLREIQ